jgi:hypothetical protein
MSPYSIYPTAPSGPSLHIKKYEPFERSRIFPQLTVGETADVDVLFNERSPEREGKFYPLRKKLPYHSPIQTIL